MSALTEENVPRRIDWRVMIPTDYVRLAVLEGDRETAATITARVTALAAATPDISSRVAAGLHCRGLLGR
jgi:hypothetical protein